jgi:hypothetical protein
MNDEFTKLSPKSARSRNGFVVRIESHCEVVYEDETGEIRVDSEWLIDQGIALYRNSHSNKGIDESNPSKIDTAFSNIIRTLRFLGYHVEVF